MDDGGSRCRRGGVDAGDEEGTVTSQTAEEAVAAEGQQQQQQQQQELAKRQWPYGKKYP